MSNFDPMIRHQRAAARRLCSPPRTDGSMRFWRMEQIWEMAAGLPVKKIRLDGIKCLDEVRWFGGPLNIQPTCRTVAEHARDIHEADFAYPIILSPQGEVVDGMHRLCKAWLLGLDEIDAVQLPQMPPPRGCVLPSGEEVLSEPGVPEPKSEEQGK